MGVQRLELEWAIDRLPVVEFELYSLSRKLNDNTFLSGSSEQTLGLARDKKQNLEMERELLQSIVGSQPAL